MAPSIPKIDDRSGRFQIASAVPREFRKMGKEIVRNQRYRYTYPQSQMPKIAIGPGSIFDRQSGSKFNRRQHSSIQPAHERIQAVHQVTQNKVVSDILAIEKEAENLLVGGTPA